MSLLLRRLASLTAMLSMVLAPFTASAVTIMTDLEGTLIKGSQPAVYFYGEDGKRYVFPNDKIFFTWYSDFSSVQTISDEELASIQIGGNVTYRPGTKLVKVTTDPKVYAVGESGKLRWIISEELARAIYGDDWAKQVQDLADAFFADYEVGSAIQSASDFNVALYQATYKEVQDLIPMKQSASVSAESELEGETLTHEIQLSTDGLTLEWTDTETSPLGYKVVYSLNQNPTYPTRTGDKYIYLDSSSSKSVSLVGELLAGNTYYVRVCNYLGGSCGSYSNQVTITVPEISVDPMTGHVIVLSTNGLSLAWTDTATSTLGYKVVYSLNQNPTYPTREGDSYLYYSDPATRSATITGLSAGKTYYVRVCNYLGGSCGSYSNQVTITTAQISVDPVFGHVIVLSANGSSVSWTDTATSTLGYKVVYSLNQNPTYPTREGDSYLYYSDPATRSATITGLSAGKTYYVRVCNYLGSTCGYYSNQVSITMPKEEVICTLQYDPVCGTDGVTYGNSCFADGAGVSVAYEGVCSE